MNATNALANIVLSVHACIQEVRAFWVQCLGSEAPASLQEVEHMLDQIQGLYGGHWSRPPLDVAVKEMLGGALRRLWKYGDERAVAYAKEMMRKVEAFVERELEREKSRSR